MFKSSELFADFNSGDAEVIKLILIPALDFEKVSTSFLSLAVSTSFLSLTSRIPNVSISGRVQFCVCKKYEFLPEFNVDGFELIKVSVSSTLHFERFRCHFRV